MHENVEELVKVEAEGAQGSPYFNITMARLRYYPVNLTCFQSASSYITTKIQQTEKKNNLCSGLHKSCPELFFFFEKQEKKCSLYKLGFSDFRCFDLPCAAALTFRASEFHTGIIY